MKSRLGLIAAAITAGLLITGISWAALDNESSVNVDLSAGQELEIPVEDAGTVRLANSGTSLTILSAQAAAGFVVEVEVPEGREVEADFRGHGRRLQFNAELEDGTVRVRIRTAANAEASSESTLTTTSGSAANGESEVNLNLAAGTETEIPVEDAGTIRLANSGTSLTILSAQAAAGFVVEVEVSEGREVEADFRGEGRRLQFNAELEDGTVRIRIRTEGNTGNDGSTSTTATTTNGTASTSTTIDDNSGDDSASNVPSGPVTYQVAGAGSVMVLFVNGQMQLGLVAPSPGWLVDETHSRTDEVEVRFSNGDLEARLKVHIENGQVRVEIENKD